MHSWTYQPPRRDTPGLDLTTAFGGAHSSGVRVAFCDGSVHEISYDIDPSTHRYLGNRADGQVLTDNDF